MSPLLQIMREIAEHKIKIYEFPETDDEEENRLVKKIKVLTSHPVTLNTQKSHVVPDAMTQLSVKAPRCP